MSIPIRIGVCFVYEMSTLSIDMAETEWMSIFPRSKGIRALPFSMSRPSAIITIPPSIVCVVVFVSWQSMAWRISVVIIVLCFSG